MKILDLKYSLVCLFVISDSIQPKLQYCTVEIFYGSRPGLRVNGNLDPELMMELSSAAPQTISDDRGWYEEYTCMYCNNYVIVRERQ